MSKVTEKIFKKKEHFLSSPFGERSVIQTSKGNTSSFHSGADYSTYGKKLPQYAIENGYVLSCGTDYAYGGAKYVWVVYPSLGVRMLHYHLDSIKVKKGQAVSPETVLGYTGKTGRATGIHLHLGVKRLSGGDYIDPEKWSIEEYSQKEEKATFKAGNYKVTKAILLNVRKGPGTEFKKLSFQELSADARKKVLRLSGFKADGYVNGLSFSVFEVKENWGRTPSGWVCLDYCEEIS